MVHEEAARAGELVVLPRDDPDRQFFTGEIGPGQFLADVIGETLVRTNLGALAAGDTVNLERCVPAGGRLDGRVVQGHVDGTGTVTVVFASAHSAAERPARRPNVIVSISELPPRRLAPWTETQATSPAA